MRPPQALQLVVVAVYGKALTLLYVDQLLEDVKQVAPPQPALRPTVGCPKVITNKRK